MKIEEKDIPSYWDVRYPDWEQRHANGESTNFIMDLERWSEYKDLYFEQRMKIYGDIPHEIKVDLEMDDWVRILVVFGSNHQMALARMYKKMLEESLEPEPAEDVEEKKPVRRGKYAPNVEAVALRHVLEHSLFDHVEEITPNTGKDICAKYGVKSESIKPFDEYRKWSNIYKPKRMHEFSAGGTDDDIEDRITLFNKTIKMMEDPNRILWLKQVIDSLEGKLIK